jgi:hypothetical protein
MMLLHKSLSKTEDDDDPVLDLREAFARRIGAFSASRFKDSGKLFKGQFAQFMASVVPERQHEQSLSLSTSRTRWAAAITAATSTSSVAEEDASPAPCEEQPPRNSLSEKSQNSVERHPSKKRNNVAGALRDVTSWLHAPGPKHSSVAASEGSSQSNVAGSPSRGKARGAAQALRGVSLWLHAPSSAPEPEPDEDVRGQAQKQTKKRVDVAACSSSDTLDVEGVFVAPCSSPSSTFDVEVSLA